MRPLVLLIAFLVLAGCGEEERQPSPLAQSLQKGGLTLVIRHATADGNSNQQEKLSSCALQRNLTEMGKEQAAAIAAAVRRLEVPVGEVRASPMCRARDTARLAFGRVQEDRDLVSPGVIGTERDDRRRAAHLRRLAESPPTDGTNRVLVTHTGNIGAAFGEETVAEGETLLYGKGARLIGRIPAEQWAQLRG